MLWFLQGLSTSDFSIELLRNAEVDPRIANSAIADPNSSPRDFTPNYNHTNNFSITPPQEDGNPQTTTKYTPLLLPISTNRTSESPPQSRRHSHNRRHRCLPGNTPRNHRRRHNHPPTREILHLRRTNLRRRWLRNQRKSRHRRRTLRSSLITIHIPLERHTNAALLLRHRRPTIHHPPRGTHSLLRYNRSPRHNKPTSGYRLPL